MAQAHRLTNCLITGASSGLGRAMALQLSRPGAVLHLSGRDPARLASVAEEARAHGAEAYPVVLDVRDRAGMERWIGGLDRLDLAVANAGISAGTGDMRPEHPHQVRDIVAVNVDGVLNTALPALDRMRAQAPGADGWRGRIAVIASIAAFLPAPGAPAYCASKALVDRWTVGAAPTARRGGVLMTSVCPGFVRTGMTAANRFPMPGLMSAERAAAIALRGIMAGRQRVAFPAWMALAARMMGSLPPTLSGALLSRAPGKDAAGQE